MITGNVRSGREFRGIFEQVFELRRQGLVDGILFATWRDELRKFPSLGKTLADQGVTTVAIEPPAALPAIHPLFHGYVLHQRKALHFALCSLPADCFVLKARTDFAEERFASMAQSLFREDSPSLRVNLPQPILQTRLFTFDARTDYFFYWDDIVFCGMRDDLLALNNFELSPEVIYPAQLFAAEMRLFAPLFLKHYPVLAWFFENVHGEKFGRALQRWAEAGDAVPLPVLAREILAAYFHILSRYLLLPEAAGELGGPLSLRQFFQDSPGRGVKRFPTPWPSHKLVSAAPMRSLAEGRDGDDVEMAELLTRLERLDSDPAARRELRADLESRSGELVEFGRRFGEEISVCPVWRIPADSPAESPGLGSLELPEKRFLSRWGQRKLGVRRNLARWVLKNIL
ncbi:MAG TPA: hypothetical protein VIS74_07905 [Chthoniobacterales bacterium]